MKKIALFPIEGIVSRHIAAKQAGKDFSSIRY